MEARQSHRRRSKGLAAAAVIAVGAALAMERSAASSGDHASDGRQLAMVLALVTFWVALNHVVHSGADALELGLKLRPWRVRSAGVLAVLALTMIVALLADAGPHGLNLGPRPTFSWVALVVVCAIAVTLQAALRTLADGLSFALRTFRTLRNRLEVLALLSAAAGGLGVWLFGQLLEAGPGAEPSRTALVAAGVVVAGPLLWAFVAVVARGLTRRLDGAAKALGRVGQGDLDVHLEEDCRDEVGAIARAFNHMVAEVREKQFLERAFGCYLTDAVLELLRHQGALQLVAERREATVLFADVRGFTALTEKLSPEEVLTVLNTAFEGVLPALQARDGYVDKLIGDAVMCVFGVPVESADHATRGLAAARAMQAAMTELNAREAFGPGRAVQLGIGVHTGMLVAGSLGSAARAQYTVIGDTVNVASRLCAAAAADEIVLSQETATAAGRPDLGPLESLTVKNRAQPVEVVRLQPPSPDRQ